MFCNRWQRQRPSKLWPSHVATAFSALVIWPRTTSHASTWSDCTDRESSTVQPAGSTSWPTAEPSEHQSLVEACKRVPHGVVCLLSALRFHDLTTQAPFEVWLAIGTKARLPKLDYPPLRIVRFSGPALTDRRREARPRGRDRSG